MIPSLDSLYQKLVNIPGYNHIETSFRDLINPEFEREYVISFNISNIKNTDLLNILDTLSNFKYIYEYDLTRLDISAKIENGQLLLNKKLSQLNYF